MAEHHAFYGMANDIEELISDAADCLLDSDKGQRRAALDLLHQARPALAALIDRLEQFDTAP